MAKISYELRLELDKLRGDIDRGRSMIQRGLAQSFGGGGGSGLATSPGNIIGQMMGGSSNTSRAPVRPPPLPPNFRQAGLGLAAGVFSPLIGATQINQSGILGRAGDGSGIGKLLGGAGVSGFAAAYVGLTLASKALAATFHELKRAVQEGAELFFTAARLRTSPGNVKAAEVIAQALGVGNNSEIMQQLAYGHGRISSKNMASLAGMQGQGGAAEYISQIVSQDKSFWNQMAANSREFHVLWTAFSYNLSRMSAGVANDLLPALNAVLVVMNRIGAWRSNMPDWLKNLEALVNHPATFVGMAGFKYGIAGDSGIGDGSQKGGLTMGSFSLPSMSAWEKMGFQIGSGYGDQSKKMVQLLTQIAKNTSPATGTGPQVPGASGGRINTP